LLVSRPRERPRHRAEGAGGLGLHAVRIAKLMGAHPIIAVDVRAVQCAAPRTE
jgi:threonine dehydrogenase-like Zn-dependent dehydrogenase